MQFSNLLQSAGRFGASIFVYWLCFQPSGEVAARPHFEVTSLGSRAGGFHPLALNNRGDIVGSTYSNEVSHYVLFRDGMISELPLPRPGYYLGPNHDAIGVAINDAGEIVARTIVSNRFRTFFISERGIIDLDAQTGLHILPVALNNSGVILGGTLTESNTAAALTWSNGVVRYMNSYINTDIYGNVGAVAINNRNELLLRFETGTYPSYADGIWHDGVILDLGPIYGWAFNDYGHVAGASGGHAAIYNSGKVIDLGTLPGDRYSTPTKINNLDQCIGWSEDGIDLGAQHPFFATHGIMYDMNDLVDAGWTIRSVFDLNDNGQIIGSGWQYYGEPHYILLTPSKKPHPPRANR